MKAAPPRSLRRSISFAVPGPRPGDLLLVRRPPDDPDLPGVWGLPAGSLRPGESEEEAVLRSGREKLGVELRPVRPLRTGATERPGYTLRMTVWSAAVSEGQPSVPQPFPEVTQYVAWRWGPAVDLAAAAARGSLCSRLYLEAVEVGEAERPGHGGDDAEPGETGPSQAADGTDVAPGAVGD